MGKRTPHLPTWNFLLASKNPSRGAACPTYRSSAPTQDRTTHTSHSRALAATIGDPIAVRAILVALRGAGPGEDIVEHLRSHDGDQLADLIEDIRKDIPVHGDTATYRTWGHAVARYSFETYDLFLAD